MQCLGMAAPCKVGSAAPYISCCGTSAESQKMVVAVTGGTGFIGRCLVQRLVAEGHQVRVLTRSVYKAGELFPAKEYSTVDVVPWNDWEASVKGCTGVVNLTGRPISTRWSPDVKDEIKRSRVDVTLKVTRAINSTPPEFRPSVLVSASAVGYYGASETASFDEGSPSGNDFLSQVCREWESAARGVDGNGVKLVLVRIGIVLDKDGGALERMVPMFKLFAGGTLGSGMQWFSWVHREDLVSLMVEALQNPGYQGIINATAPNPVRMAEVCETIGDVIGRPSWLPIPDLALKALLGEGASAVLEGQRVLPRRAQELGFEFKYRYLRDALNAILNT